MKILVTGAGGSIGSEICRQLDAGNELILLGHSELPLYTIDKQLRGKRSIVLADIRDYSRVKQVIDQYQPDVIYHCAAIKHVPLAELHPCEAVLTNIIGTRNVAQACMTRMVLVSTDKAVNPISVMGKTKRVAELLCGSMGVTVVRLGNVTGSSGSVVPLFQSQIDSGGPVTVAHEQVDRYFITIDKAAAFIIRHGLHAGLYIPDMGEPINIYQLAQKMIKESGKNVQIEFTGLRQGDKLHEELRYPDEVDSVRTVDRDKLEEQIAILEYYAKQGKTEKTLNELHR